MDLIRTVVCLISVVKLSRSVPEVKCKTGTYRGSQVKTYAGVLYNQFLGIKFATVAERFSEAVPADVNTDLMLNATTFGPACLQTDESDLGEEDCLFLNVYTPDLNGSLPVLFYIYGGAFSMGATYKYDPEFFMETRRIVVVTVAYRLGAFGFLYLDDPNYPANLGIRDQIVGLKWVRDNIGEFGGDPARITLNGQSAGAASVNILMHSPLAKGLFVGGISESGTSCSPWALQPRCSGLYRLKLLATKVGCHPFLTSANGTRTADKVVECLRNISSTKILESVKSFPKWDLIVPFPPIVESTSVDNAVITVFPWLNSSSTADMVPWISGFNSAETTMLVKQYYPKGILEEIGVRLFNSFILSHLLYYSFTVSHPILVTLMIKFHYIFDNIFNFETFLSNIMSIDFFNYPNYQCMLTSLSPSYGYYFSYQQYELRGKEKGVGHGGELPYLWKQDQNIRLNGNKSDVEMSTNLVNSWIDFAYNQFANFSNVTWERYDNEKGEILIIDDKGARMGRSPNRNEVLFWRSLETNLQPMVHDCDL